MFEVGKRYRCSVTEREWLVRYVGKRYTFMECVKDNDNKYVPIGSERTILTSRTDFLEIKPKVKVEDWTVVYEAKDGSRAFFTYQYDVKTSVWWGSHHARMFNKVLAVVHRCEEIEEGQGL